jgi:hypothetical protein
MRYYREPDGDYLAVDPTSRGYYVETQGRVLYEGRATAIAGLVSSVCTTSVAPAFLADCTPVRKADVPREWLRAING